MAESPEQAAPADETPPPCAIEVTVDARHEVVWLNFDALKISELKNTIASTFGVPADTAFVFKYKGV